MHVTQPAYSNGKESSQKGTTTEVFVAINGWATKSIQDRTGLVNDGKMFYYREKER